VRRRQIGFDFDGAPKHGQGFVKLTLSGQCGAQIVMGFREVVFECERAAIRGDGLDKLARLPERNAQIIIGFRHVRVDLERPAVFGDGLAEPALVPQCVSQIVAGIRVIRLEFKRPPARRDRFVEPAGRAVYFAEIGMSGGIVRVEDEGLANPIHRELVPADLVGDETQKVQSAGMIWLRPQDLAVKRLGFGQPPGLMALKSRLKRLWNRHGGKAETLKAVSTSSRPRACEGLKC